MAVSQGDLIKAQDYNYYVMGLDYTDPFVTSGDYGPALFKNISARTESYYIWMRGSRTDSAGTPLPVPYPSYNTFRFYVKRGFKPATMDLNYIIVNQVTWDGGGEEIITPVDTLYDTDFGGQGTIYYRYYDPGYYRIDHFYGGGNTGILPYIVNRDCQTKFKPWQNQVEVGQSLRAFNPSRQDLGPLGKTLEFTAGNASLGLFADELYLGGDYGGS